MRKRVRLFSYNRFSNGAKELARAIGALRIKHTGSRYRQRPTDVVINWGASECPLNPTFNQPDAVRRASDKLLACEALENHDSINGLEYTTDRGQAQLWIEDGRKVVCRTLLRANSGRGIVLAETADQLVDAPLYTKYIPKQEEYRLHVVCGEVIDVQRKARSREVPDEDVNWQIRNHGNGFVFVREGVEVPDVAKDMAVAAVECLGLDFGAVDMIYNSWRDQYYVLEVNTAPGLEGTTLERYAEAFTNAGIS